MQHTNKTILVDCDGVLLDWLCKYCEWMELMGYEQVENGSSYYDLGKRFDIPHKEAMHGVTSFNKSTAIKSLPAFRDAVEYVTKLHNVYGYTFHCITSLSLDATAEELRQQNLDTVFGSGVFTKLVCLDTGAPKEEALEPYKDSGLFWVEDKFSNAVAGLDVGLKSILIEHNFNMQETIPAGMIKVQYWKDICEHITGETQHEPHPA